MILFSVMAFNDIYTLKILELISQIPTTSLELQFHMRKYVLETLMSSRHLKLSPSQHHVNLSNTSLSSLALSQLVPDHPSTYIGVIFSSSLSHIP